MRIGDVSRGAAPVSGTLLHGTAPARVGTLARVAAVGVGAPRAVEAVRGAGHYCAGFMVTRLVVAGAQLTAVRVGLVAVRAVHGAVDWGAGSAGVVICN